MMWPPAVARVYGLHAISLARDFTSRLDVGRSVLFPTIGLKVRQIRFIVREGQTVLENLL